MKLVNVVEHGVITAVDVWRVNIDVEIYFLRAPEAIHPS